MTCIICGKMAPPDWRAPHVDEDAYPARCPVARNMERTTDSYGDRPHVLLRELGASLDD